MFLVTKSEILLEIGIFLKIKREKNENMLNLREPEDWLEINGFFFQILFNSNENPGKIRVYSYE